MFKINSMDLYLSKYVCGMSVRSGEQCKISYETMV